MVSLALTVIIIWLFRDLLPPVWIFPIGIGIYFASKALMMIAVSVLYRILLRRLPKARLEVEGHVLEIPYLYQSLGPITRFTMAKSAIGDWRVMLQAMRFPTGVSQDEHQACYVAGSVPATIVFGEVTLNFTMKKEHYRCPCNNPIPCWAGDTYHGFFNSINSGGADWIVEVYLLHFDGGKKRRWWRRIELPKPSFSFLPQLNPI